MPGILVIGCASKDVIHLEQSASKIDTIGGAGLYTALAVRAIGVQCTLLGPNPTPPENLFSPVRAKLDWIGPVVAPENLPCLELVQHGNDRATLLEASWGAEALLTPDVLPDDLSQFQYIHIAALSTTERQLQFLNALKSRTKCKISAGTYAHAASSDTDGVRRLLSGCDYFFMNENEAEIISFTPRTTPLRRDQTVFVTRGRKGASVFTYRGQKDHSGIPITEVDATGAGDTFCGTMLGAMAKGMSEDTSALVAVERSARVVTDTGPSVLQRLIN